MNRFVSKLRERATQFMDLIAVMHQAKQCAKASTGGRPIFHVDDELRWRSLLRVLDSRIIHFGRLFDLPDKKRKLAYNQWVEARFIRDAVPIRYQGKGFCLVMPEHFQNAAAVVINDLREIYLENHYTRLFPYGNLIDDGDVVIDCGASIGAFAIYAASLGPNVRVLAFEPEPVTFEVLCRNVEINGLAAQVQSFQYGVAAYEGDFVLIRNESCFTMHRLIDPERSLDVKDVDLTVREITVRCVTIDQMLNETEIGKCNIIKMDIEGAERVALRGAVETIRRYHPKLTIAAYHLLSDAYVLPVMIKEIAPEYNILVSQDANLFAFV